MAKNVMMKGLVAAGIVAALGVNSAMAASINGNASANVLTPLSIAENAAMSFGDVSGDADSATTVVLTTGGTTSSADGAYAGGTPAAGDFTVSGAVSAAYTLTLPASITLTGTGADMTVTALNSNETGTLGAGGTETFQVGGTLNIGAGQTAGSYTGTYAVTVAYQ